MNAALLFEALARSGLVLLFLPFSALDKIFNFRGAVGQAREIFVWPPLAVLAILAGLTIEIIMSLGVVLGVADRACALVIAAYSVMTAILWKQFWTQGDFWADPNGKGRGLFWDFLKNLSLAAGFLLVAVGTDGTGLAALLAHPLGSSHPYAARAVHPHEAVP